MAVQEQQLSDAFVLDLRFWERNGTGSAVGARVEDHHMRMMSIFGSFMNHGNYHHQQQQQSHLARVPVSRKRTRDQINDEEVSHPVQNPPGGQQLMFRGGGGFEESKPGVWTGQLLHSSDSSRFEQSDMTSTSGGSAIFDSTDNLIASCFQRQRLEMDAIVRFQNERMKSIVNELSKRQCRTLLSTVERGIQKKLAEKDSELERATRRSMELEVKLKQITTENQIWFGVARNNEAVVTSLRTDLQQALLRQNFNDVAEGFGDSGGGNDDQQSSIDLPKDSKGCCKVCGVEELSILLLPCRHFCLCKSCQSKVDTCPVCKCSSYACIHVIVE